MIPRSGPTPWLTFLAALALAYLTAVVFFPMLGFEFIPSDVMDHVVHNPHIRGLTTENLTQIFTYPYTTSYYPVRTLTYALDYQLWGLDPGGFKLTNGLIHLANTLLVFWLALRLTRHWSPRIDSSKPWADVAAATAAGAVFAVHPVVVEPVVWVSGREELLMTLGALGCLHFHLAARRQGPPRPSAGFTRACHVGATVCCGLACFSNAVAAVIPLLITAWDLLMPDRPKLRDTAAATAGLWIIALVTISIKSPGSDAVLAREVATFSAHRVMLVLNAYWLNIRSIFRPTELALAYPRLAPGSFLQPEVMLGGTALCVTCGLLWSLRRRGLILFAVVWFGIALGPAAQVMSHHIHRADRFLYLPLVGLALALGLGLRSLANLVNGRCTKALLVVVAVVCLFVLVTLSTRQVRYWQDSVSLWRHSVAVAPDSPDARRALADCLAEQGQLDLAIGHYETALRLEPDFIDVMRNLAFYLVTCSDHRLRDDERAIELSQRACQLTRNMDPGTLRMLAMAYTNRGVSSQNRGRFQEAIGDYEKAIQADPQYEMALFDLAMLLATCPRTDLHDPRRAIDLAERAAGLVEHLDPTRLSVLGAAYAAAGRFDRAVAAAEKALEAARPTGNPQAIAELQRRLRLYRNRTPYHDPL